MMPHRPILATVLVLALVTQVGCAGRSLPPPTLEAPMRASLGTIAVSWIDTPPRVEVYSTHTAGRGAAQGATVGLKAGTPLLTVGSHVPNMGGVVVGLAGIGVSLAGVIIGTPIGAIVGATKAPPRAEVRRVAAAFADHANPFDVGGCIGAYVHQTLRRTTSTWSVLAPVPAGETAAKGQAAAAQGIDTVIELGPLTLEVSGPFGTHPEGDVLLTTPLRVVRPGDGTLLLSHEFRWRSMKGANWPIDAAEFAETLESGCRSVALDVVNTLGHLRGGGEAFPPDDHPGSDHPE